MVFIEWIIDRLSDVSGFIYQLHFTVSGWVWPFNLAAGLFYSLHLAFFDLAEYFTKFNEWVDNAAAAIANILSFDNIATFFSDVFDGAINAWNWVKGAFLNVWNIVDAWWSATAATVQGWISIAVEGLAGLRVAWSNFWTTTLPNLVNWQGLNEWWNRSIGGIEFLVNTAFVLREGFWSGWQDFREQVAEFFGDPLEFLLSRFTDWFLGPEE